MTCMPIFLSHRDMRKKSAKKLKILFAIYFDMAHNAIKNADNKKKFSLYVKFVVNFMCFYYRKYIKKARFS